MNTFSSTFTASDFMLMLQGAGITFVLTIVSGFFGTVLGFFIGWGRSLGLTWMYSVRSR